MVNFLLFYAKLTIWQTIEMEGEKVLLRESY